MSNGDAKSERNGDWKSWLMRQGFPAVLVTAVLWFLGYQVYLPMQAAHIRAVDSLANTNEENSDTLKKQTAILDRLEKAVIK